MAIFNSYGYVSHYQRVPLTNSGGGDGATFPGQLGQDLGAFPRADCGHGQDGQDYLGDFQSPTELMDHKTVDVFIPMD